MLKYAHEVWDEFFVGKNKNKVQQNGGTDKAQPAGKETKQGKSPSNQQKSE